MAPAREKSTENWDKHVQKCMIMDYTHSLKRTRNELCTESWVYEGSPITIVKKTYQSLKILPIFALQATVCFPNPIPTRCIMSTSSEEHNSVVAFH